MTPTRVTFGEAEVITGAVVISNQPKLSQLAYYIRKRDRVLVRWVEQSETQHFTEEGNKIVKPKTILVSVG